MPGLRIGIDVGGTFTHGVLLEAPGRVLASARVPTTHRAEQGVAAGIAQVIGLLLDKLPALGRNAAEIELVAHSTTQATNALLEGDLSGVHLFALYPPGEKPAVAAALSARTVPLGGGQAIALWPKLLFPWSEATAQHFPAQLAPDAVDTAFEASGRLSTAAEPQWQARGGPPPGWDGEGIPPGFRVSARLPVVIVQPLAGRQEAREATVAAHYAACGHSVVCAGEISQVLGLAARSRTAVLNAAMLPTMLATADFTARAVRELLPGPDGTGVPLQVVRSDGGAMALSEMRQRPIGALLSGPAAGASAALHFSGQSDFVFIEVGGTSTDISIVSDGRVRQRSAEVGGQRLLVPALELRTVAVGGGSMLRADGSRFGPRSAHIAGLPYLFQALQPSAQLAGYTSWQEEPGDPPYLVAQLSDGSQAAVTLTDWQLVHGADAGAIVAAADFKPATLDALRAALSQAELATATQAFKATIATVEAEIHALAKAQKLDLSRFSLLGGGGGAPVIAAEVGAGLGLPHSLIAEHSVISAIGAALAVTCVALSRSVAEPHASDIAELTAQVEARLAAQGAERVSTDYDYDPQRQVLTVTGRGNRPYSRDSQTLSDAELAALVEKLLASRSADTAVRTQEPQISADKSVRAPKPQNTADKSVRAPVELLWSGAGMQLWQSVAGQGKKNRPVGMALDNSGRVIWRGPLLASYPARGAEREAVLATVLARHMRYGDGGAELPGLALLASGRLVPLDQLGSLELIAEVLRLEAIGPDEQCCFIVRG